MRPYMCPYMRPYMCPHMCPYMRPYMCPHTCPYMRPYMCPYTCPYMRQVAAEERGRGQVPAEADEQLVHLDGVALFGLHETRRTGVLCVWCQYIVHVSCMCS